MAVSYRYRAQNSDGRIITGEMKANDEAELHGKLKNDGMLLIDSKEVQKGKTIHKKLKYDRVSDFARNLGKLLGAGVTLVRALRIISEDESIAESERKIYADILRQVRSGMTLSDAMEEQGGVFPALFVNMIRSAETGGNMDQTASNMAEYYSKEYRLQQKIKSSTTYPKILGVLIVIAVKGLNLVATGQIGRGHAVAASLYNPTIQQGQDYKRNRWTVGFDYKSPQFKLHGEYLEGYDADAVSRGAYVTGSVPLGTPKLEFVGGYDFFNFNTDLGMDQHKAVAGLQYWFFGKCRVQAQYVYKSAYIAGNQFVHGANHALMCQLQVRFN